MSGTHAVVIGGSMAGLLSARALMDHFEQVTIVERDRLPEQATFRAGVPQSRHLHLLLGRGRELLEQLLPGLEAELLAAGAQHITWPTDVLFLTPAGWCRRFPSSLRLLSSSREVLEWNVRRRLAAWDKLRFLDQREVVGLLANADKTAVAGVQIRARSPEHDGPAGLEDLPADLVVDASGRASRAPQWLESMGYKSPPETRINGFLGYASRYYAIPQGFAADWKMLFLNATPAQPRGGGLTPIEGNRWWVTLAGMGHDYPPTDDAGFLAFARSLRSPVLYEAIRNAEPLSPIRGYQRTENQLRHFERLPRWPDQFVVAGDAACAFNPIYGQGMTAAAQAAVVLDRCLCDQRRRSPERPLPGLGRRFQRELARTNADTWLLATGEDLRYPTTEGARPGVITRLMHRYLDRVVRVSTQHAGVNRAFLDVVNLLAPPTALFRPSVLVPVMRGATPIPLDTPPAASPVPAPPGQPAVAPAPASSS